MENINENQEAPKLDDASKTNENETKGQNPFNAYKDAFIAIYHHISKDFIHVSFYLMCILIGIILSKFFRKS